MIQILAIGDLHIQPDNLSEINIFLNQLEKWLIQNKVDLIVILGDTLHTHETVYTECLNKALEYIKLCEKYAHTEVLIGNHDFCFAKDTPVLMYDGTIKYSQDIKIGDILAGDDNTPRNVLSLTRGNNGKMYDILQSNADTYTVTENHILCLQSGYNGHIFWNNSKLAWTVKWFCLVDKCLKSKMFSINRRDPDKYSNYIQISKEESLKDAQFFVKNLNLNKFVEITVKDYLCLPKNIQERLYGYKKGVDWNKTQVHIDPYILGMWLGDGSKDGKSISSADLILINAWEDWCIENKIELVHGGQYNYYLRNYGKGKIPRLGEGCLNCKACIRHRNKYNRAYSLACANSMELQLYLDGNSEMIDILTKGASKEQLESLNDKDLIISQIQRRKNIYIQSSKNPEYRHIFVNNLSKYNLIHNKYIPDNYIYNDRETRLQLLAGFIDTDGTVFGDRRNIVITQSGKNSNMIQQLAFIANSLGYNAKITKKYNTEVSILYISGKNLSEIPIRLPRKKCTDINEFDLNGRKIADNCLTNFTIVPSKLTDYYGWTTDGNHRFLLKDFTVVHNCNNQQFLTTAHPFSGWKKSYNIVDTVKNITIENYQITLSPFVPDGRFYEALRTAKGWEKSKCIFAHQLFDGAKMGPIIANGVEKWGDNEPMLISGHIHDKQKVQENLWYTGSSMQISFGEREDHTISLVKIDDNVVIEEIDIHPPSKKTVYCDISNISETKIPSDENVKVKVSVSGDSDEFKTFKKSVEYQKLIKSGVKVVFKQKKSFVPLMPSTQFKSFPDILFSLLEDDVNLMNIYNQVIGYKEICFE